MQFTSLPSGFDADSGTVVFWYSDKVSASHNVFGVSRTLTLSIFVPPSGLGFVFFIFAVTSFKNC